MNKTVLITGASSGFGLLTSVTLAKRGWHVLATMRDLDRRATARRSRRATPECSSGSSFTRSTSRSSIRLPPWLTEIGKRAEPLHALVNNAGFAVPGFAEDVTDAELREQFDTNFFGAVSCDTSHPAADAAAGLRPHRHGLVDLGPDGFPGVSSYAASKFALEGWTETLRYEMRPLGIQVVLVEPGSFETDIWTRNAKIDRRPVEPELAQCGARAGLAQPNSARRPQEAPIRRSLLTNRRVLENPRPKLRYVVGNDANMALMLRGFLPSVHVRTYDPQDHRPGLMPAGPV